jgi:sugar phosphate isomerase/epimerase
MHFSIEDTIRKIGELGYSGIEVLADVPHAWPSFLLEERKQSIRDHLRDHNLQVANVNAFMMNAVADPRQPYWHPGWTDPDPHYRAIRREHTKRALQMAKEIGAPNLTTEPGGLLTDDQTWSNGADLFYEELMPCVEVAEKLGKDAEGRLTYNKRVIQMYPISAIKKLYRAAELVAEDDE